MAAHDSSKTYIEQRLCDIGKVLIAAVGEQMGINKNACSVYSRRLDSVKFFPEVSIRYSSGESTRFGEEKLSHYRNDGILFIRPGQWGLNSLPSKMKAFTVGLEIKERLDDLAQDAKILLYMGWTDFYFLVVPKTLEKEALAKLDGINDARLGLLVLEDEMPRVARIPLRQDALYANKYAIAMQCLFFDREHNEVEYELSGCEKMEDLDPCAYQNAFRELHPEFNGAEDTYLRMKDKNVGAMTVKELRNITEAKEAEGSLGAAEGAIGAAAAGSSSDEDIEKKEKAAQRKAAKLAREEALVEALAEVDNVEVKKRLVVQRNDAQTLYHTLRKKEEATTITAEQLADEIGVSKRTVESSLASLREAGLIRSEGSKKKPQITVVQVFEEEEEYAKCSLFTAVKSPSEKRRIKLVCSECPIADCPAHP